MKQSNNKIIKVNDKIWKELQAIKYINNLKTINDGIEFLINKTRMLEQKINSHFDNKLVKANRKEK